jgi:hypothetical protein
MALVRATVGSACDARLHFKSVPNFSRVFFAVGSSPHTTEPEKGNPIKESQCQNQNAPVPKSSAYDSNAAHFRCSSDFA